MIKNTFLAGTALVLWMGITPGFAQVSQEDKGSGSSAQSGSEPGSGQSSGGAAQKDSGSADKGSAQGSAKGAASQDGAKGSAQGSAQKDTSPGDKGTKGTAQKDQPSGKSTAGAADKDKSGDTKGTAQRDTDRKAGDKQGTAQKDAPDASKKADAPDKSAPKAADKAGQPGEADRKAADKAGQPGEADRKAADKSDRKGERVQLTDEKRTRVRDVFTRQNVERDTNINIDVSIGTRVPRSARLYAIPAAVFEIVPEYRNYRYVVIRDEICIVDPETYEIVTVVERSSTTAGRGSGRSGSSSASLSLSDEQRTLIIQNVEARGSKRLGIGSITVGMDVPRSAELVSFPTTVVERVPDVREYRYFVHEDDIAVVNPSDSKVVLVIEGKR